MDHKPQAILRMQGFIPSMPCPQHSLDGCFVPGQVGAEQSTRIADLEQERDSLSRAAERHGEEIAALQAELQQLRDTLSSEKESSKKELETLQTQLQDKVPQGHRCCGHPSITSSAPRAKGHSSTVRSHMGSSVPWHLAAHCRTAGPQGQEQSPRAKPWLWVFARAGGSGGVSGFASWCSGEGA